MPVGPRCNLTMRKSDEHTKHRLGLLIQKFNRHYPSYEEREKRVWTESNTLERQGKINCHRTTEANFFQPITTIDWFLFFNLDICCYHDMDFENQAFTVLFIFPYHSVFSLSLSLSPFLSLSHIYIYIYIYIYPSFFIVVCFTSNLAGK